MRRRHLHATELMEHKKLSALSNSFLPKHDRSGVIYKYRYTDNKKYRTQQNQPYER